MCGIFGIIARPDATLTAPELGRLLTQLFRLSESRGREAAGLATTSSW